MGGVGCSGRLKSFRLGREGEGIAREWLVRQGYWVIPASLIDNGGAPALVGYINSQEPPVGITLPDVLAFQGQSARWVEVKVKSRSTLNQVRRREEHGIEERHWQSYMDCVRQTGIPGALAIVEVSQWQILLGDLEDISKGSVRMDSAGTVAAYGEPMRYFDRTRFDWHPLDELPKTLESSRPKTARHPWDTGEAAQVRQLPFKLL